MEYTIRVRKGKNGWLCGQCEQLPEAITQGKDMDELMFMMEDAIKEALEIRRDEFREKYANKMGVVRRLTISGYETKQVVKTFKRKQLHTI